MDKKIILVGMAFGSTMGGYIPIIFGTSDFSLLPFLQVP